MIMNPALYAANLELNPTEVDLELERELEILQELKRDLIEVAAKKKENKSTSTSIVSLITRDDIDRYGATDLFEVLNRVTSMYMLGVPAFPKSATTMRGDSLSVSAHVLVLINGRPFRDSTYGGFSEAIFRSFPLHHVQQIEIMRGSGSALYGTNAYSGVINIVTKRQEENSLALRGRYGTFETEQVEAELAWKNQDVNINMATRYHNSRGPQFSAVNEAGKLSRFQENNEDISASLTGEWQDFTLNAFVTNVEANHWGTNYAVTGVPFRSERLFLDLGYKKQFTPYWSSQWNFTYNQQTHEQYSPPTPAAPFTLGRTQDNSLLAEQTHFFNFFDDRLNFLVGSLVEWQSGRVNQAAVGATLPEYSLLKSSFYGEINYALLKNLKLTLGGQWQFSEDLKNTHNSTSGKVGRLGLVYEITPNFGVKLLYNQAFRLPNAQQLGIDSTTFKGNSALQPERVETADAQIFYHTKDYQAALTAFRSRQSQLIVTLCTKNPCPPNTTTYTNQGSGVFSGLELETQATLFKDWHWQGSYTFQTNRDGLGQNNLTQMPNHLAKIGLSWDVTPDIQLSAFDSFASKAKIFPTSLVVNPVAKNYHLLSVNLNYRLDALLGLPSKKHLQFSFYVNNLLDEKVYYPDFNRRRINTIPASGGRSIFGEIAIEF
jgi:outer membrane cobalamin receptor